MGEGRVSQKLTKPDRGGLEKSGTPPTVADLGHLVVRKLTWGEGGGVSQKLTKPDKGGRGGGRKKPNFN